MSFWTDENLRVLRELAESGHSAGEIAKLMRGPSRNAIIGKTRRLGIALQGNAHRKAGTAGKHKSLSRPQPRAPMPADQPARDAEWEGDGKSEFTPSRNRGIPEAVTERAGRQCRWPIGDPADADFHFCARQRPRGSSYCDQHARTAVEVDRSDDNSAWYESRRAWAEAHPENPRARTILRTLAERSAA